MTWVLGGSDGGAASPDSPSAPATAPSPHGGAHLIGPEPSRDVTPASLASAVSRSPGSGPTLTAETWDAYRSSYAVGLAVLLTFASVFAFVVGLAVGWWAS